MQTRSVALGERTGALRRSGHRNPGRPAPRRARPSAERPDGLAGAADPAAATGGGGRSLIGDPARFGLWPSWARVSMLFIGFTSAYIVRRASADWRPLAAPARPLAQHGRPRSRAARPSRRARRRLRGLGPAPRPQRLARRDRASSASLFVAGQFVGLARPARPRASSWPRTRTARSSTCSPACTPLHLVGGLVWFARRARPPARMALHPGRGRPAALRHLLALPRAPLGSTCCSCSSSYLGRTDDDRRSRRRRSRPHWGGGAAPFGATWQKTMMWIFIVTDALLFSGLLCGYGFLRMASPVPWPEAAPRSSASPSSRS